MRAYPRYRDSGVEWLGGVPEHWEVLPIKQASRIVMGQSPPSDTYQDEPVERPFLQGNAEFGPLSPTPKWYCDAAPKVVEAGALLLSVRAPVGALNTADQTYGIGRGLCGVVANLDRLEQRFAWWTLHVTRRALEPLAVGSTYDAVSAAEVGELLVPLPPLDEQRAIAAYLDRETERIDALVAKKRLLIERLEEYRTALITRTVTRGLPPEAARAAGLDPSPRLKPSGVEWLGDVPEHWVVKELKWETPVLRGASPRPIDDEAYFDDDGSHAWVRISDVTAAGMYLEHTTQRLSQLGISLSVPLSPGDLFLSIAGSVGKPCITNIPCCIHDGFVYFPRWRGDTRFLYYVFASGEPYKGLGKLGTQLNLNTDTVGAMHIGVPPILEQTAIADFLVTQLGELDLTATKAESAIERLQEYRTALITAAVTGKVDVRE